MPIPNIAGDIQNLMNQQQEAPPGADKLSRLIAEANKAKADRNQQEWKIKIDEIILNSKKSMQAQEERNFKQAVANQQKLDELIAENTSLKGKVAEQANKNAYMTKIREMVETKNYKSALWMLATVEGYSPQLFDSLTKLMAQELVKDPRITEIINAQEAGLDKKGVEWLIVEKMIKPAINKTRQPNVKKPPANPNTMVGMDLGIPDQRTMTKNLMGKRVGRIQKEFGTPKSEITGKRVGQGETQQTGAVDTAGAWRMFQGKENAYDEIDALERSGKITPEQAEQARLQELGTRDKADPDKLTGKPAEWDYMLKIGVYKNEEELAKAIRDGKIPNSAAAKGMPYAVIEYQTFKAEIDQMLKDNLISPEEHESRIGDLQAKFMGNREYASAINVKRLDDIRKLDKEWANAYFTLGVGTQTTQVGANNFRLLGYGLQEALSNPNLTEEQRLGMIIPAVERFIYASLPDADPNKKRTESYRTIAQQMREVERHIRKPREGWDLGATGFLNSTILHVTRAFGHVIAPQADLAKLDNMNNAALAEYIKATSGLAVTDSERKFLASILFNIKDGVRLTEAKIRGWRALMGKYLTEYYTLNLGSEKLGLQVAEYVMRSKLPEGQFITEIDAKGRETYRFHEYVKDFDAMDAKIREIQKDNPNITLEDLEDRIAKLIPEGIKPETYQQLRSKISEYIGLASTQITNFINDNKNLSIGDAYEKLAEDTSFENLDSLLHEIKLQYERVHGKAGEVSENIILKVKRTKGIERWLSENADATLNEFVAQTKATFTKALLQNYGWIDKNGRPTPYLKQLYEKITTSEKQDAVSE